MASVEGHALAPFRDPALPLPQIYEAAVAAVRRLRGQVAEPRTMQIEGAPRRAAAKLKLRPERMACRCAAELARDETRRRAH